jgi:hypothetical protein
VDPVEINLSDATGLQSRELDVYIEFCLKSVSYLLFAGGVFPLEQRSGELVRNEDPIFLQCVQCLHCALDIGGCALKCHDVVLIHVFILFLPILASYRWQDLFPTEDLRGMKDTYRNELDLGVLL